MSHNCVICNKTILWPELPFVTPANENTHQKCYEDLQAKTKEVLSNVTPEDKQEAMFNKIRGLLRKAENTLFEAEADAFMRKAQELMQRYRIDEEALWENDPERRSKIEEIKIGIRDKSPGAVYKRLILREIAELSNCRMWYLSNGDTSVVAGYSADLVWVDMLFTSIMTQAGFKMAMAQAMAEGVHARTFRNNFWDGFCSQINKRLREQYKQAQEDTGSTEGTSTALAIVSRKKRVDDWVNSKYSFTTGSARAGGRFHAGARASGTHAADTTDISGGRQKVGKAPRQIGKG